MYGKLEPIETKDGQKIPGFPVFIEASEQGPKTAVLRLPNAGELIDYLTAQKHIYRDLGRRQGETQYVPTPDADRKLFNLIRIDKGPDFDDAEVEHALNKVTWVDIESCERDGQAYVITLKTPFGMTNHTVGIPFRKDMAEYQRNFFKSRELPHGAFERRFPPQVPCKLYDRVIQISTGYEEGVEVPPHHKRSVVSELVSTVASLDSSLDPNS